MIEKFVYDYWVSIVLGLFFLEFLQSWKKNHLQIDIHSNVI